MQKVLGAVMLLAANALPASAEVPVLASQAIDNEQVTAWDITLKPDKPAPPRPKIKTR